MQTCFLDLHFIAWNTLNVQIHGNLKSLIIFLKSFSINEKCLTCYETFRETPDETVVPLLCSHAFHYDCIYMTYKAKQTNSKMRQCPLCRKSFLESSPINNSREMLNLESSCLKFINEW